MSETNNSMEDVQNGVMNANLSLVKIVDIRRSTKGLVEFQIGDESDEPYERDGDTIWVKAHAFYYEWPD